MTLLKNQIYLRNDKGVEVQSDCANVIAGLEYSATFSIFNNQLFSVIEIEMT